MSTARTNNSVLRYVPEVTFGTTPVDDAGWKVFPTVSESLDTTIITTESARVRSDRGSNGTVKTGEEIGGDAVTEFQADQHDDLLEAVMMNDFAVGTLTNGSVRKSFTFEKEFTDLTNKFESYAGVRVGTAELSAQIDGKADLTFGLMGVSSDYDGVASLVGAGSETAVASTEVMTIKDLGNITINSVAGYCYQSLNLSITNNHEFEKCAGSASGNPSDVLEGKFEVSGSMVVSTTDNSWATLALKRGHTYVPISFQFGDGSTTYTFTIHEAAITFPDPANVGENESVELNIDFTARQSTANSATLTIVKS